jgi:DNA (cytosine-5)-methyltransferase 1
MNLDLFPQDNVLSEIIPLNNVQELRFIDLFAGIGGFHLALSDLGAKCVFASEKDSHARSTYQANFDTSTFELNQDIRKIAPDQIPDHEILCAGFPCQPFSQAGLKKGFQDGEDSERGNLFFCIVDILETKKPLGFILENVRHLVNHDEGQTFQTILTLLDQAGYTVYHQILKASDYNVPQHRPRVFLVGFRKDIIQNIHFNFPQKKPLTYTMSDIFGESCEKQVGFTLRVGGKGSKIDDRRNWEFYRVNGEVKRIGLVEAKRMMTFPDDFQFPVSKTQAMKQLGNSVCVEVVRQVATQVIKNIQNIVIQQEDSQMTIKRNKGELSEIYALCKLIQQQFIAYGNEYAEITDKTIQVIKVHTYKNEICLSKSHLDIIEHDNNVKKIALNSFITETDINQMLDAIQQGKSTFSHVIIDEKVNLLGLDKSKGTSYEKADITISFVEEYKVFEQQGTSIKSFLGNSPTLLNASQATNFIFKINGLDVEKIDTINSIKTSAKIKDRILAIENNGGALEFVECENQVYEDTLRKVDSKMPEILAAALLGFFKKSFRNRLCEYIATMKDKNFATQIEFRLKDFVKSTMFGIFPTQVWDGKLSANSVLLVNQQGELVFYHTNHDHVLKEFFYQHTFFDTPSSTRHRFGSIYQENGQLYFKLNLQLRLAMS